MKITEHLENAKTPLISFEITPPERGGSIEDVLGVVRDITKRHSPSFIHVTSRAADVEYLWRDLEKHKRMIMENYREK